MFSLLKIASAPCPRSRNTILVFRAFIADAVDDAVDDDVGDVAVAVVIDYVGEVVLGEVVLGDVVLGDVVVGKVVVDASTS